MVTEPTATEGNVVLSAANSFRSFCGQLKSKDISGTETCISGFPQVQNELLARPNISGGVFLQ